jgi:hypothetical protein
MGGAQRYPSIAVREVDGFREGLNPSTALAILPHTALPLLVSSSGVPPRVMVRMTRGDRHDAPVSGIRLEHPGRRRIFTRWPEARRRWPQNHIGCLSFYGDCDD